MGEKKIVERVGLIHVPALEEFNVGDFVIGEKIGHIGSSLTRHFLQVREDPTPNVIIAVDRLCRTANDSEILDAIDDNFLLVEISLGQFFYCFFPYKKVEEDEKIIMGSHVPAIIGYVFGRDDLFTIRGRFDNGWDFETHPFDNPTKWSPGCLILTPSIE